MTRAVRDRALYWPFIAAVGCPLVCLLIMAVRGNAEPWLLLLTIFIWIGAAVRATIVCISAGDNQAWRRMWSSLILPPSAVFGVVTVLAASDFCSEVANYVRLLALSPSYRTELAKEPEGQPRFKVWQWGGEGPCWDGVAYDDNDKIAGQRREESDRYGKKVVASYARAFGHFYFVDICYVDE